MLQMGCLAFGSLTCCTETICAFRTTLQFEATSCFEMKSYQPASCLFVVQRSHVHVLAFHELRRDSVTQARPNQPQIVYRRRLSSYIKVSCSCEVTYRSRVKAEQSTARTQGFSGASFQMNPPRGYLSSSLLAISISTCLCSGYARCPLALCRVCWGQTLTAVVET